MKLEFPSPSYGNCGALVGFRTGSVRFVQHELDDASARSSSSVARLASAALLPFGSAPDGTFFPFNGCPSGTRSLGMTVLDPLLPGIWLSSFPLGADSSSRVAFLVHLAFLLKCRGSTVASVIPYPTMLDQREYLCYYFFSSAPKDGVETGHLGLF